MIILGRKHAQPDPPAEPVELDTAPGEALEPAEDEDEKGVHSMDAPGGPLADDSPPEHIAAAAEQRRQAAAATIERAERERAEAGQVLAEAQAEAARILAEAKARSHELSQAAMRADHEAEKLGGQASSLASAAQAQADGLEAAARADALEADRDRLAAEAAALGERIGQLAADRDAAAALLAAALEAGDLDAVTAHRGRITAIDELASALSARRASAQASAAGIGDGTETFANRPLLRVLPPLAVARQTAAQKRQRVRQALNFAFPRRPEAISDAAAEDRRLTIEALRSRHEDEARAARQAQPRTIVHL